MPKQKKDSELELDISTTQPQNTTFAQRWFRDIAVNNAEELKTVCDLTDRSAQEQFSMYLQNKNPETYAVVFYATFMSILDFIREKQKRYNNFSIVIANSINIGYTNNDNEDNEKVGNFMPLMEYVGINRTIIQNESIDELATDTSTTNLLSWKQLNTKQNVEFYKDIQDRAFQKLKSEFKTNLRTAEAVIPLFCIFLDHISNLMKIKYQEALNTNVSEVSMNVFGLFDIFYSFNEEENLEIIEFQPNITMKLALKSDSIANRD
jgi:hypothetical protein